MKIQIDQSLKLECTEKDTVVAFSNHIFASVLIRARDKREIQRIFRLSGEPKFFVYKLFAIIIFILIKDHLKEITQIIIDEEYPGKNKIITDVLMQEIKKAKPDFDRSNILFQQIGKKSRAHFVAWGIAMNRKLPDKIITLRELLKFLLK